MKVKTLKINCISKNVKYEKTIFEKTADATTIVLATRDLGEHLFEGVIMQSDLSFQLGEIHNFSKNLYRPITSPITLTFEND